MFRVTFYVQYHGLLVVPHLYTSVPTCSLRVLDNDTGEEIPRVFQRVSPHVYMKNKRGYTFVAEGRSGDKPIPEGKCRLRLIGSEETLLRPKHKGKVNCEFYTKELKEYYLPNRDYEFVRYGVKVSQDMVVTVRLTTSKESAYIKIQILDTIDGVSACGRGHAVIPAFVLLTDGVHSESPISNFSGTPECPSDDDDRAETKAERVDTKSRVESRATQSRVESRATQSRVQSGASQSGVLSGASRMCVRSAAVTPGFLSPHPQIHKLSLPILSVSDCGDNEKASETTETGDNEMASEAPETASDCGLKELDPFPEQFVTHNYVIRAVVERNSWNEDESAWDYFCNKQSNGNKLYQVSDSPVVRKMARQRSKTPSVAKSIKEKEFNTNVAHWTLRIVTSEEQQTYLDVNKDTKKEEQIKAMKAAWEAAEPGRAAKAKLLRQLFLQKHGTSLVKTGYSANSSLTGLVEEEEEEEDTTVLSPHHKRSQHKSLLARHSSQALLVPSQKPALFPAQQRFPKAIPVSPFKTRQPIMEFDFSRFVRKCPAGVRPTLLDEDEIHRREKKRQEDMEQFHIARQTVLKAREQDRQEREKAKRIQLETAEEMQRAVDEARDRINRLRETYRLRCLEKLKSTDLSNWDEASK